MQNRQENEKKTIDIAVAMWYDIYNEREQQYELARRSKLIGSRAISFPRSKVHPFAETILHQKGGRGPMASEESQLHMLSTSGASPVMQS